MGTMGNDDGVFQRLQYTGTRVEMVCMCACMKEEEKDRGKKERREVGRRWEIDLEKNLGKHAERRL